uniref:NADH-ubiquinone oxidoreductase chain 4 n=1 Tax=Spinibdella lignicola TaxID=2872682 RepID=A0A977X3W8_9ACAR|nr:NADH dehydrogenase subunit 4 [Spinibdella lignicola]UXN44121.1 NADH dehydrogenase subunit 4 [Spinibdella lignicola]
MLYVLMFFHFDLYFFVKFTLMLMMLYKMMDMFFCGMYLDFVSFFLIYLVFLLMLYVFFNMEGMLQLEYSSVFLIVGSIMLGFLLMLSFVVWDFFYFYLMFEFSVIPMFLLIVGWGYSVERIQAGMYMFLYTMFFSLPFLMFLMFFVGLSGNSNYLEMQYMEGVMMNLYEVLMVYFIFFVKLPIFYVHLWLPKAHVEAPLIGSMILAGLLLKLGGYGMYRYYNIFCVNYMYSYLFIVFYMWYIFIIGIECLRQIDLKILIAYSSVVHMGLVVLTLTVYNSFSLKGSLMVMFSHGFCSSMMFFFANVGYDRFMSRSIVMNSGMMMLGGIFAYFWLFICFFSLCVPPTYGFVSELMVMFSTWNLSYYVMLMAGLYLFIMGIMSILMYVFYGHGFLDKMILLDLMSLSEMWLVLLHMIPLLYFILFLVIFF